MSLQYSVSLSRPHSHEFDITLTISYPVTEGQIVTMPAWIPGSYMVRDFAKNIVKITAEDTEGSISLEQIDKQSWRLGDSVGDVTISYRVYAWDLSVRSSHFDNTHAYFNGTSVFLRVVGHENRSCHVSLIKPTQSKLSHWYVSTTLPSIDIDRQGFGEYSAVNYDSLIDYPVEVGTQKTLRFEAFNTPHSMALTESVAFDENRLIADLEAICAHHAGMFGDLPLKEYLFLVLCVGDGYGGLEHLDSTSLMCNRTDLPKLGLTKPDKGYRRFLGLCSHEYFHLWNVKRIRPEVFKQANLSHEVHSELLWAFEGITSYYDDLALVRCGCIDPEDYLDTFAVTVTRVMKVAGRKVQSAAESSFNTWTKFYKQDENAPNAIVSYYTKGALVAFGLDIELRRATDHQVCLDDLMRLLWARYGKVDIGIPERGIEALVNELSGKDMSSFFLDYVYGTEELPLDEWFAFVGIGYRLRAAKSETDFGSVGKFSSEYADVLGNSLGLRTQVKQGLVVITQVFSGGSAEIAGLAAGDALVAIDGEQITTSNLNDLAARYAPDSILSVHYFRRHRLFECSLSMNAISEDTCELSLLPDDVMTADQKIVRAKWFGQTDIS